MKNKSLSALLIGSIVASVILINSCKKDEDEIAIKKPVAAFTSDLTTADINTTIQFTDKSTNKPTSWKWTFGDGQSSNLQNPTHVYTTAGNYTVSLTATNAAGSDTQTKNNYITANPTGTAPVVAFTVDNTVIGAGQTLQFTDQSTETPTSWSWDFGDGNSSTEQNPSHIYNTAGVYSVSLTATNAFGSDTKTHTDYIDVGLLPEADFTSDTTEIYAGQSIDFTDTSINTPTSWSWDFGDGETSTSQNPNHIFNVVGTYTVSLSVTNDYGSDTTTKTDFIHVVSSVTDIDGNIYQTVIIGSQIWMAEDLIVTHYPNGDPIPHITSTYDWSHLGNNNDDDAFCYYTNEYNSPYGALYNYAAAIADAWTRDNEEGQGICPDGWHLPTYDEMHTMWIYVGSPEAGKLKEAGIDHWKAPNTDATNETGFTALPGGKRDEYGTFLGKTEQGNYWNANASYMHIRYDMGGVMTSSGQKNHGVCVRCIKNVEKN